MNDNQTVDTSICRRSGASTEICNCRYCTRRRRRGGPKCEVCGRETEYLFAGYVVEIKIKTKRDYSRYPTPVTQYEEKQPPQPGMVCQRCRPASNLEKQDILDSALKRKR